MIPVTKAVRQAGTLRRRAQAGQYAEDRYRRGLRAYRRRVRLPLLVAVTPAFTFALAVIFWRGIEWWSFIAGVAGASAAALASVLRDDAPHFVLSWKRGAEGERKTEKALRRLDDKQWKVEHDIQWDGWGNLDHVVIGPPGVFLLETKNLSGTISFQGGILVVRQIDDPDEVYHYKTLPSRMRGAAKELSTRLGAQVGRAPWVTAVVVIWGDFQSEPIHHENVVYVPGGRLVDWLEARAGPRLSGSH